MEDIQFNFKTNKKWLDRIVEKDRNDGIIIKFLRFQATKKLIDEGGIKPVKVPEDKKELIESNWKTNKRKLENDEEVPSTKRRKIEERTVFQELSQVVKNFLKRKGYDPNRLRKKDVPEIIASNAEMVGTYKPENSHFDHIFKNIVELMFDNIPGASSALKQPARNRFLSGNSTTPEHASPSRASVSSPISRRTPSTNHDNRCSIDIDRSPASVASPVSVANPMDEEENLASSTADTEDEDEEKEITMKMRDFKALKHQLDDHEKRLKKGGL